MGDYTAGAVPRRALQQAGYPAAWLERCTPSSCAPSARGFPGAAPAWAPPPHGLQTWAETNLSLQTEGLGMSPRRGKRGWVTRSARRGLPAVGAAAAVLPHRPGPAHLCSSAGLGWGAGLAVCPSAEPGRRRCASLRSSPGRCRLGSAPQRPCTLLTGTHTRAGSRRQSRSRGSAVVRAGSCPHLPPPPPRLVLSCFSSLPFAPLPQARNPLLQRLGTHCGAAHTSPTEY